LGSTSRTSISSTVARYLLLNASISTDKAAYLPNETVRVILEAPANTSTDLILRLPSESWTELLYGQLGPFRYNYVPEIVGRYLLLAELTLMNESRGILAVFNVTSPVEDAQGRVIGYLDFGTVVEPALPGLDLMHRIVHDRKQLTGARDGETWRELSDPQRLWIGERRALERYARRLELDPRALQAVAQIYPVFVGAIIERYAPFVRPDWFRHTFGI